jgi:hypothetical protein
MATIYDNDLTSDLLDRCDGPVTLDVISGRVVRLVADGKFPVEEICAASVEAINVLKGA